MRYVERLKLESCFFCGKVSMFFFRKLGCILQIHQMFSSIRYVLDEKHRDSRDDLE